MLLSPVSVSAACVGYSGPGGPCYTGPGGGLYTGPGGGAYTGPGGGAYTGPGGGAYTGPGGGAYGGPGGPCFNGPGGGNPDPWNLNWRFGALRHRDRMFADRHLPADCSQARPPCRNPARRARLPAFSAHPAFPFPGGGRHPLVESGVN